MARKKAKAVPFPLKKDQYFSTPVVSARSTSSGPAVVELLSALGLEGREYTEDVRSAVRKAQEKAGLPQTGVVDAESWDVLVNGESVAKDSEESE